MIDEGYLKYKINWEETPPSEIELTELIQVRNHLWQRGLIGYYPQHHVGYGNISQLDRTENGFWVSGTQTGHLSELCRAHFTQVIAYDLKANSLSCRGPVKASSESLTHAAIYDCSSSIKAVIHVHHLELWEKMMAIFPVTANEVPYGTPEMAAEVYRLYADSALPELKAFAMGGHEEGVFAFGPDLQAALAILSALLKRYGLVC